MTVNKCSECYWQMSCNKQGKISVEQLREGGIWWGCMGFSGARLTFEDAEKMGMDIWSIKEWQKQNKIGRK